MTYPEGPFLYLDSPLKCVTCAAEFNSSLPIWLNEPINFKGLIQRREQTLRTHIRYFHPLRKDWA